MGLRAAGGTFGGARKPCEFMCLTLKLLQIQPDKDIIIEYIRNDEFKYVRLLGALHVCCITDSQHCGAVRFGDPDAICTLWSSYCCSETCSAKFHCKIRFRAGAFYMRLVGKPLDVYNYVEPLLNDFRKVQESAW